MRSTTFAFEDDFSRECGPPLTSSGEARRLSHIIPPPLNQFHFVGDLLGRPRAILIHGTDVRMLPKRGTPSKEASHLIKRDRAVAHFLAGPIDPRRSPVSLLRLCPFDDLQLTVCPNSSEADLGPASILIRHNAGLSPIFDICRRNLKTSADASKQQPTFQIAMHRASCKHPSASQRICSPHE